MTVLDTSFLIEVERGASKAKALLSDLESSGDPMRIPAAAWVEYLSTFGPADRAKATGLLEASVTFEPFTRGVADEAARLQHELMRSGRELGWHDLQIAATAMYMREPLVTADRSFGAVPGLDVRRCD